MSGNLKNPKKQLIDQKKSARKQLSAKSDYHDDYDQIQAAVLETKRGRWFLGEFARKNKQIESKLVLDAIAELEGKVISKPAEETVKAEAEPPKVEVAKAKATKAKTAKAKTAKAEAAKVEIAKAEIPEPVSEPKDDFETEQQSTHFAQLFAKFKHATLIGLEWAGIKTALEFSQIQTIINFAASQSQSSLQTQEKKLNAIITDLQTQNVDPAMVKKLSMVASELSKLKDLQNNLNAQLKDGMKFMGEVEKIAQNIEPDFEKFTPKPLENEQKTPEKPQKIAKNEQKTAENELKAAENEQKTAEIEPKNTKLGPAGRIKKMFKIEQTLHQQQAENLIEPAKAFDEAFATEQLKVETNARSVSTAENIEKDLQPVEVTTKISEQSEKLAEISNKMKQADDKSKDTGQGPRIIIENEFNALNSLALLSKTERTMLFTLQN